MIPHFALLFTVSGIALIADNIRISKGVQYLLWGMLVLTLAAFAGFRGDFVGADTFAYVSDFENLVRAGQFWRADSSAEFGYKVLLGLARWISTDPTTHLVITSLLASTLYATAIYRLSKDPALSLFLFIAFGFFVFHMNGLRQGLALGVYMHAIPTILKGQFGRYVILVLIAAMFHKTAYFLLPLYPLFRLGFSVWSFLLTVITSATLVLSLNPLFALAGLVSARYSGYGQRTETGGSLLAMFFIALAGLFIALRPFVKFEFREDYNKYLMILIFGAVIYGLVLITSSYVEITRMALYFTCTLVFLWPIVLRSIDGTLARLCISTGLIVGACGFYAIFLSQIGGYIPYTIR